jgi:hypothetical protein
MRRVITPRDVRILHDRLRMGGATTALDRHPPSTGFPVVLLLNIPRICPDVVPVQFNRLYLDLGRAVRIDTEGR